MSAGSQNRVITGCHSRYRYVLHRGAPVGARTPSCSPMRLIHFPDAFDARASAIAVLREWDILRP
jgi:hypothetical protein